MSFAVSCSACGARFMLGDDLFKRRVQGKVVTIKCRHCPAEIAIDGTHEEVPTKPSNEAPAPLRRPAQPHPPRRDGATALAPGFLSLREETPKAPPARPK